MDEYKVKITPQASLQMLEIFSYISGTLKEPVTAEKLLDELRKSIFSLKQCRKEWHLWMKSRGKVTAYIKCL